MKFLFQIIFLTFSHFTYSQSIYLSDFKWSITDIAQKGFNKKSMFEKMNRTFVRLHDSICSNRAQIWACDFKRKYNIDTTKIFLFYTSKNGTYNRITWPKQFTREERCKEIKLGENDLIEYIYRERVFPIKTYYGEYGCYYVIAPEGYWIPRGLALLHSDGQWEEAIQLI